MLAVARSLNSRVLLVEDDAEIREGLAECLELEGAQVRLAGSGNEGFAMMASEVPDVIVSDLVMPDGDGYEFITRIRALSSEKGGTTPAIAISCLESSSSALKAGFHVFIKKPFDSDDAVRYARRADRETVTSISCSLWRTRAIRAGKELEQQRA